jgi:hypothetical protein
MPASNPSHVGSTRSSNQFVSRVRAAEMLDCSVQLIDKFIRLKKLRAFYLGRKVIVRCADLLALVAANEIGVGK